MTRPYRMKVRAERHADTRRRIVEAAVQLHRTVGPKRFTITEIARRAGVERPTVMRHFPNRISLLMACTFGDPLPDPSAWQRESDPQLRLSRGLSEQYAWYRRNRVLLRHLLNTLEADDSLAPMREAMRQRQNLAHQALTEGWRVRESARARLELAVRHALNFWTWLSLEESGVSDADAVGLMVDMIGGFASA